MSTLAHRAYGLSLEVFEQPGLNVTVPRYRSHSSWVKGRPAAWQIMYDQEVGVIPHRMVLPNGDPEARNSREGCSARVPTDQSDTEIPSRSSWRVTSQMAMPPGPPMIKRVPPSKRAERGDTTTSDSPDDSSPPVLVSQTAMCPSSLTETNLSLSVANATAVTGAACAAAWFTMNDDDLTSRRPNPPEMVPNATRRPPGSIAVAVTSSCA